MHASLTKATAPDGPPSRGGVAGDEGELFADGGGGHEHGHGEACRVVDEDAGIAGEATGIADGEVAFEAGTVGGEAGKQGGNAVHISSSKVSNHVAGPFK
jgi:hypothetical protein